MPGAGFIRNTAGGSPLACGLQAPQGRARTMRFVFNDPYTLRGAVHEMAGSQPVATRERDLPIPVDVYQLDKEIVIEGAIPGARLEDLDLSCQDGLLTLEGEIDRATASFESGVVRITIPRRRQRVAQTIKVRVANGGATFPGVTTKPEG